MNLIVYLSSSFQLYLFSINLFFTRLSISVSKTDNDERKPNAEALVLADGTFQSAFFYLSSCSCFSSRASSRLLTIKQLVPRDYQASVDVVKTIKSKKERLSKTSYYNNMLKLKEYYVKTCRNLHCFGCVLFTVKEVEFDRLSKETMCGKTKSVTFKRYVKLIDSERYLMYLSWI